MDCEVSPTVLCVWLASAVGRTTELSMERVQRAPTSSASSFIRTSILDGSEAGTRLTRSTQVAVRLADQRDRAARRIARSHPITMGIVVRPFRFRDEPALDGQDYVIRGGPLDREATERNFARCKKVHDVSALSVAAAGGLTPREIIEESALLRRYFTEFLWCLVADLWSGGYALTATFDRPHYSLILPGDLTDETWEDLAQRFSPL